MGQLFWTHAPPFAQACVALQFPLICAHVWPEFVLRNTCPGNPLPDGSVATYRVHRLALHGREVSMAMLV